MSLLLLVAALGLQDPIRVNARLTDDRIEAGQTTVLRVEVETDGPRARIDRITRLPPGLELASTRDFDQRQFSLPGGTRRFITREFVLRARAAGQFRIPSIDVVVENRRFSTGSLLLTVGAGRVPAPEGAVTGAGNVMLRAWLDADTVYVGEQVSLQVEAMFSQEARLRLRRAPEYEAPRPPGFWVQDLPDPRTTSARRMGADIFEIQGFRRAFFPLTPGHHEIPPARLTYEMRRGMLYAPETFEVRTEPMPLVVLPVPEEGRPAGFTGAVGRFDVRGSIEPTRLTAGEAALLTIEVEGTGNVKALPPPDLEILEGFEIFPPSEESATEVIDGRVRGSKTFTWVVIAREAGTLELPRIRYPYWDPDQRRFETAGVLLGTVAVTPGGGSAASAAAPVSIRYLKTAPAPRSTLAWVRTPGFVLLQAAPLALLLGALVRRRRAAAPTLSRRVLRRRRRAGIRELERRAPDLDDPGLFADADAFARAWLADRLGTGRRAAGTAARLEAEGVPPGAAAHLARVLERMAAARYAPVPPTAEERRALVAALGSALERIDRETPGRTARRATAGAAAASLALMVAPGLLAGQQAGAFGDGLAAFDDGRYHDAAMTFDGWVAEHPQDPAGWYNLGTAYHRAGYPGYAAWAWLHVPRLDPRDRDVRHNLDVAGVAPELVRRAAPPLPLRQDEALLLLALAWWIIAGAGAWWVLRRSRGAAVAAVIAALLALLLGAGWLAAPGPGDTLVVLEAATLRAGPTLRGDPLAELDPGAGLDPVAAHGDWRRVRTLDGREGWIEGRAVGTL